MPRGVYDRSKSKEQRAAEKSSSGDSAPKTKRKYTRRNLGEPKAITKGNDLIGISSGSFHSFHDNKQRLETLQSYFTTLVNAKNAGLTSQHLDKALTSTLEKTESIASQIWNTSSQTIPTPVQTEIEKPAKKNGAHLTAAPAPVAVAAPAPVAFNPPAPPQS